MTQEPANDNKITLDSTLRNLYSALRNVGGELMAIEFRYKGNLWRADTPQEAVALRNELQKEDKVFVPEYEAMEKADALWTPDKFIDVIDGTGELQRHLLAEVFRNPGITSKQLVKKLGLESEIALAGVISGLSKKLKQLDIEPKNVFLIDVKWTGKKKTRRFILDDFFLQAGIEQGWPAAWENKR
jgi:hypothetical protein